MKQDISELLQDWPFDPDNNIRIVRIARDREVMQVRQPMGIEQYELDGRPDGIRPFGHESFLVKLENGIRDYKLTAGGEKGYQLNDEDFIMLQNEGILYYYRYLHLFQLNDYRRTARDTEHNLRICRFVEKYGSEEVDVTAILQYKPYILRMHAVAKAMSLLNDHFTEGARQILEDAIHEIDEMKDIDTPAFKFEKIRSVQYLQSTLKQLDDESDDPLQELKLELEAAVEAEEYERAAEIRDQISEFTHMQNNSAADQG